MEYIKASNKQRKLVYDLIEKVKKQDISLFGYTRIVKPNDEYICDSGSCRLQELIKDLFAFLDFKSFEYRTIQRAVIMEQNRKLPKKEF